MRFRKIILLNFGALLVSCTTLKSPNLKGCQVAGILAGGAYCAYTQTEETQNLTAQEFIKFLEPDLVTEEPGAVCIPFSDVMKMKIFIAQACRKLGNSCTKEMKDELKKTSDRITNLAERTRKRPK